MGRISKPLNAAGPRGTTLAMMGEPSLLPTAITISLLLSMVGSTDADCCANMVPAPSELLLLAANVTSGAAGSGLADDIVGAVVVVVIFKSPTVAGGGVTGTAASVGMMMGASGRIG